MTKFERLFGVTSSQIKRTCVVMPLIPRGVLEMLKVGGTAQGALYRTGLGPDCTLIMTGIGPAFTGDALLYLKKTPCRNVILFGSCGLVKAKDGLSIGSLVVPLRCDDSGSFPDMLVGDRKDQKFFFPNNELVSQFLASCKKQEVHPARCCSVASLKLEEERRDSFVRRGIEVLDMECAAFFAAASYAGLRAIALFYVSDIVKKKPFYGTLGPELRLRVSSSIRRASSIICTFISKHSED